MIIAILATFIISSCGNGNNSHKRDCKVMELSTHDTFFIQLWKGYKIGDTIKEESLVVIDTIPFR